HELIVEAGIPRWHAATVIADGLTIRILEYAVPDDAAGNAGIGVPRWKIHSASAAEATAIRSRRPEVASGDRKCRQQLRVGVGTILHKVEVERGPFDDLAPHVAGRIAFEPQLTGIVHVEIGEP